MVAQQETAPIDITPYCGLRPFTQSEALYFYGREIDTELVSAHLLTSRLTVFFGSSGVGKSSLLMAGVIPYFENSEDILLFVVKDWSDKSFLDNLKKEVCARIWNDEKNSSLSFFEILEKAAEVTSKTIAFIFDQFEDYFDYQKVNTKFESELATAINTFNLNVNFLLSMRDDHLSQLDRLTMRIPNILDNTYRLQHLDESSARDAIQKPLDAYKEMIVPAVGPTEIEPKLVNELIKQCAPKMSPSSDEIESDMLYVEASILQLALDQIWKKEKRTDSNIMRLNTLREMGEVKRIIEGHINEKLKNLTSRQRQLCAKLFDRIVTPSGRKLAYSRADLSKTLDVDRNELDDLLRILALGESRILRTLPPAAGAGDDNPRYELFHDKLAEAAQKWQDFFDQEQTRKISQKRFRKKQLIAVSSIVVIAVGIFITKYFYDEWLDSPYAYLTDLSNDKQYAVSHNVTLISRYTNEKQPENFVPISPSRIVSRNHFMIFTNINTGNAEAVDLRSSFGTMINADYLQYGEIHQLHNNDVISLAGNQNFRFMYVDKSIFPKPPQRHDPVPSEDQWGLFIDGTSKNISALSDSKYYVSYDLSAGYSLMKEKGANSLAEVEILSDRRDDRGDIYRDENGNPMRSIYITDLSDDKILYLGSKTSRFNAYDYAQKELVPNRRELVGISIEARPIVFHYNNHYFQIVTVPQGKKTKLQASLNIKN